MVLALACTITSIASIAIGYVLCYIQTQRTIKTLEAQIDKTQTLCEKYIHQNTEYFNTAVFHTRASMYPQQQPQQYANALSPDDEELVVDSGITGGEL